MKKLISTLLLLINVYTGFSQTDIIRKSGKDFETPGNDFAFIEPATDTTVLEFVATIKSAVKNNTSIQSSFFAISALAKSYGANCFKLNSFSRNDSTKEVILILDTYLGNDSILNINFANHEENTIYVIGSEIPDETKTYSFKVNGKKKTINSGTYFKQVLKAGEEIKINKGGITGMSIWFNYKAGRKSSFYSLTGVTTGGLMPPDMVGIAVSTGRLDHIQGDLGCLLKNLLIQSQ